MERAAILLLPGSNFSSDALCGSLDSVLSAVPAAQVQRRQRGL
jgi:hypothetical protein